MTIKLLACAMAALALTGCATEPVKTSNDPTYEQAAADQFVKANYAAADALISGINIEYFRTAPMLVATVVNLNELTQSSPLGRAMSEHYSTQLVQRGFSVKELKLRDNLFIQEGTGELLLSREVQEIARLHSATAVVVGTYTTGANIVYVNTKIVRAEDGRVLSAHDYTLPLDRNIRRLLGPSRY